jgi:hypothetical protein
MASVSIRISLSCLIFNLFKGFVQRCFTEKDNQQQDSNVIPYPFTIYPSPYPRNEYEKTVKIQDGINILVQRLAFDIDLMDTVFQKLVKKKICRNKSKYI